MKHIKKHCYFIKNKIKHIDFRDIHLLEKFLDAHGRVLSRKRTGVSAEYQRKLENAIKRSRFMGLIPFIKK